MVYAILVFGVFACSTAVIFVKLSWTPSILLAAYRLLIASLVLSPLFLRQWRRHRVEYPSREFRRSLLPGVVLAFHFIAWIMSARMTTAVNATIIVTLMPVAMPFFLFFMMKEQLTRRELLATLLSVGGFVGLTMADFDGSAEHFRGDLLCFVSMLLAAYYLAIGRRHRDVPGLWLYLVPLYFIAGLVCLAVSLVMREGFICAPDVEIGCGEFVLWREVAMVVGLSVAPTVIGHSILNYAMARLRGQVVSIFSMGQFVFAALMAYWLFGESEIGGLMTYVFAVLLVVSGFILLGYRDAVGSADDTEPAVGTTDKQQ